MVAFIAAATQLGKPIRTLTNVQSIIQRGLAAAEDLFAQIDTEPEPDNGTLSLTRARGDIEFEQVSFSYPESDRRVLDEVNLHIPAGAMVAFVGRSGAGKTSLIQLLCRFYDPTAGQIRLDGQSVETFKLADYRQQFALVSQRVVLFSDTIRANIAFGQGDAVTDEAIQSALEAAHASAFV